MTNRSETSSHTAFEIVEQRNGFHYRWPADDETALLRGPFPNRGAAETAAMKTIEEFLAESVLSAFGIN
jgi:hypothetical protein